MNLALAAIAAVAFLVGVGLAIRHKRELDRAESRVEELTARVEEAVAIVDQLEQEKRRAEVRASAAEGRSRSAEQRSGEAERRAGAAEKRVAEARRTADEAARRAAESAEAGAVWELERLRAEREWLDVVGPGIPLPVPWDGSVGAVVATELSVIREVVGTTSEVTWRGAGRPSSPAVAAAAARLGVELVRSLARSGEEMAVEIGDDFVSVIQLVPLDEPAPDLTVLREVAARAGLSLTVEVADERSTIRLSFSRDGK
jgi:hypothetical protein